MELYIVKAEDGKLILNRNCPEYNKELKDWCGGEPIGYFYSYVLQEITFENNPQKIRFELPEKYKSLDDLLSAYRTNNKITFDFNIR